jgi:CRP-like cAMP-binding protein
LVAQLSDGRDFEVGLVGREGLAGLWPVLGSKTHVYRAVAQVPGAILKIKLDKLRSEFARGGTLQDAIHGYTRCALTQIAQTAVCNRAHRLSKRLARWLLMTRDRAGSNEFPATHEFLSSMLGASRTDVTLAAGSLRKAQLISYTRGQVKILDTQKLEATACECYKVLKYKLTTQA